MPGVFLAGRILFGGFFLLSGLNHFFGLGHMTEYAGAKGIPLPGPAVIVTGLLLVGGGLSMILGYLPRVGAWLLVLFLVPVAFLMHDFWAFEDPGERRNQMLFFLRNMALTGAAFMILAIPEPWPKSVGSRDDARPDVA